MPTTNVSFAVIERAASEPSSPAFYVGGRTISYSRTVDLMVHFAHRMQAVGITRQSLVGLATNDLPTATIAALAVALLGGRWTAMSNNAAAVYPGITHLLTTVGAASLPGSVMIDRSWVDAPRLGLAIPDFPGQKNQDDIWMITHSSGTTGTPKFIPITYDNLWSRVKNPDLQDEQPLASLMLFSPTSYVGVRSSISNLVHGGVNLASAPWADLKRAGLNRVTGSPSQVSATIFQNVVPSAQRVRSLRATGAAVSTKFVDTAFIYFDEVQILYGATEFGTATLVRLRDPSQFDGGVGLPYADAQIEVVDDISIPNPPGSEGIIRVRTSSLVSGYLEQPALTAQIFRDGWFYPGDRGFITSSGSLHITGRTNDVINVGGSKFNAAALDEVIQNHPDVYDGFCFISSTSHGSDIVSAIVTLRSGAGPKSLHALRSASETALGPPAALRRAYVVDTLPRNDNGKPMRALATELASALAPIELQDSRTTS